MELTETSNYRTYQVLNFMMLFAMIISLPVVINAATKPPVEKGHPLVKVASETLPLELLLSEGYCSVNNVSIRLTAICLKKGSPGRTLFAIFNYNRLSGAFNEFWRTEEFPLDSKGYPDTKVMKQDYFEMNDNGDKCPDYEEESEPSLRYRVDPRIPYVYWDYSQETEMSKLVGFSQLWIGCPQPACLVPPDAITLVDTTTLYLFSQSSLYYWEIPQNAPVPADILPKQLKAFKAKQPKEIKDAFFTEILGVKKVYLVMNGNDVYNLDGEQVTNLQALFKKYKKDVEFVFESSRGEIYYGGTDGCNMSYMSSSGALNNKPNGQQPTSQVCLDLLSKYIEAAFDIIDHLGFIFFRKDLKVCPKITGLLTETSQLDKKFCKDTKLLWPKVDEENFFKCKEAAGLEEILNISDSTGGLRDLIINGKAIDFSSFEVTYRPDVIRKSTESLYWLNYIGFFFTTLISAIITFFVWDYIEDDGAIFKGLRDIWFPSRATKPQRAAGVGKAKSKTAFGKPKSRTGSKIEPRKSKRKSRK